MGQNRQVPELPDRKALESLTIEHLPRDCWRSRSASYVRLVVQHLQLASCSRGMEGKKKGVLRAPPRQVVMICILRGAEKSQWKDHGSNFSPFLIVMRLISLLFTESSCEIVVHREYTFFFE